MTLKKYRNHSCESFCNAKSNFDKTLVQPVGLYFLFAFCTRNYPWWSLWRKNTKNNCFIQVKLLFLMLKLVTLLLLKKCSFWRHINVSYNNQTGFLSQIVLLWATCWHRKIKTLKHLIIGTSYSLGSIDVITNINTMTPINPFIFLRK